MTIRVPASAPTHHKRAAIPAFPRQYGQGSVEFALASVPIMLLALGGIEATHWFWVQQTVSQALLQAARAGITSHAKPAEIGQAFDQSMQLLFPPRQNQESTHRQKLRYDQHIGALGSRWHMQIASPSAEHFARHADTTLAIAQQTGYAAIRNSYQLEQHRAAESLQPSSKGMTIFDANTLTLRVTYPHSPLLPSLRALFMHLGNASGTVAQRTLAAGYLPIVQQLSLPMQSHPVQWPISAATGFFPADTEAMSLFGAHQNIRANACKGLWCPAATPPEGTSLAADRNTGSTGAWAGLPSHTSLKPTEPTASAPLSIPPDDAQCGISVCCL